MSKIFFTSDLHFSHANIIKFCPTFRPQDVAEMDEYLIRKWNETVSPQDTVYNLGDVSFARDIGRIEAVLRRLNGTHHLIFGNHDGLLRQHAPRLLAECKWDGLPVLASAQDYLLLDVPEIKQKMVLFHYPIQEWDGCHKGWYHLHGHIHDRTAKLRGRVLNVGWDLHGRFLTADDVDGFLRGLPKTAHFGDKNTPPDNAETAAQAVRNALRENNGL
ncbi:phosphoesterase [Conchiformibius kuhniae]|uniref:Phosphoesterase n=1 Tax=Conchiformibius kuhniae TaxID=211502 RepID=A0A8T9MWP7_9NEIS|nr:phosphoesterase [Conchiformibius kuhniae]UOP04848.1 phosphoesterase [Conchiformibius kuhniae]